MEFVGKWQGSIHAAETGGGEECSGGGSVPSDAALVRAGQAGVTSALEQLVSMHQRSLYAVCRGVLGSAEDAEDAVQETFLRAFRSLESFRGNAAFRTWLFRIALNVCHQWNSS